jgi:putative ABC transport system permease protein
VLSLAVTVVVLTGVAVSVAVVAGLGQVRALVVAVVRAALQLSVVGVVIAAVFRTPALAPLYLAVVLGAASWTSGRRLGGARRDVLVAAASIAAGACLAAAIVFACGALTWRAATGVPFVAQLVGGSMTATTLSGQRFRDDVAGGWDEVEGWLALGARPARAVRSKGTRAAARALAPALDQTRTVGLVTLPGAYVGLLLGGATPLEAGKVQLLVLVGLLAAETVAVVVATQLLASRLGHRRPTLPPG